MRKKRVGRLDQLGVGHVLDADVACAEHDCCSHATTEAQAVARVTDPVDPGTGRTPSPRAGRRYARRHGREERDPRVPDLAAGEDHAGAGRAAHVRRGPRRVPGFAARRSRCWPASASTTTRASSAATRRRLRDGARGARPGAAARRRRARASLRSRARGAADDRARRRRRAGRVRPSVQQHARRDDRRRRRSSATGDWTSSPRTGSGRALYSEHFASPRSRRTRRGSSSSTRARRSVLRRLGAASPTDVRRDPARRRRGATRTTATSPISSASSRRSSELFRTLWAAHNVRYHDTGIKRVHHPLVGELKLNFEAMELVADPGLTMFVYTAEPGSKSEEALNLLASWTATPDEETTDADHEEQPRHERRPERLVHRLRLRRHGRGALGRLARQREQRPLHARARAPRGTRIRTARRSSCSKGAGVCQRRGGPVEVIRPGDRVFFEPGRGALARCRADAAHAARRDAPGR